IASGIELTTVQKIINDKGDVGLTAAEVLTKKPRTLVPIGKLTIHELFEKLHKIAVSSGSGSQDIKTNIVAVLLQKASPEGAKYVTRIVMGTLRMGVGEMTVLDALAIAFTGDKKNKEILEQAYNICPDVGIIAETIATKGLRGVEKIDIHVGRPIKMMLAQRVEHLDDIPKKMPGKVMVDAKYDGERVQAHRDKKGKVTLFSRRLENTTEQFPDIVQALEKMKGKEFVVEGEIIALDKHGNPLPFQTLMKRRRKYDVEKYRKEIPVVLKLFDLLYYDGHTFLNQPHSVRLQKLEEIIPKSTTLKFVDRIVTDDVDELNAFFKKMLQEGYEGVIVKAQDGVYQAGTRGWNWIKWKKEYGTEMVDTFDLVVVGAYFGRGKRHGVYGAVLCAAYNSKKDCFETICKVGTGLTDEVLAELPQKLQKYKTAHKPARLDVKKEMDADVWFEPKIVVEVLAAEITKSPHHTCGSGLALRFPRFVRFREDKKAEQATTSKEVEGMYKK
ncbi:MAG: ATP-dependent DNA ligase, partial [Nanoarchaeota archaeon]|nr:ATP-dependent DNA ligase [Nanoarchaeota archaeon]